MSLDGTDRVTAGLIIPSKVAVMRVVPPLLPKAPPYGYIDATDIAELAHVTCEVMSVVELSEYFPVALKSCTEPTGNGFGDSGVMVIDNKEAMDEGGEDGVTVSVAGEDGGSVGLAVFPLVACWLQEVIRHTKITAIRASNTLPFI